MGALRCCTTFRQPCGIILERGLPLHSQLLNGGLMPQYMVLRPRGACCTTWHPGDMVQVAAFPLISHNIQLSQEGSGDSLFVYLGDAESIASNGERRQEREHSVLFPYFVIMIHTEGGLRGDGVCMLYLQSNFTLCSCIAGPFRDGGPS